MEHIPCIVIGGGVIGLAIARAISEHLETCVLEQEKQIATQISARNSGVIHAGIYYPGHYLKSTLCMEGKQLLYQYCQRHGVGYQRIGKLIVANDEGERQALLGLQMNAQKSGLLLNYLDARELNEKEPELRGLAALYSESSGIVDVNALCHQLAADVLEKGSYIAVQQTVTGVWQDDKEFVIEINHNDKVRCTYLINAAGLNAQAIAKMLHCQHIPPLYLCKGQYFSYQGESPFSHLVYPLPMVNNQGLGIHATLDMAGQCRFGPDSQYITQLDYSSDEAQKAQFVAAIQRYFPAVDEQKLQADFCGIRPKLAGPNQAMQDFVIHGKQHHGINNLINLYGMESPGLTSCLSVANNVVQQLGL